MRVSRETGLFSEVHQGPLGIADGNVADLTVGQHHQGTGSIGERDAVELPVGDGDQTGGRDCYIASGS